MKKLILAFFVLLGVSSLSFGQEANQIANSEGSKELSASKVSGDYTFTLPSNLSEEDVASNAKYYTHYFEVNFDKGSSKVSITMKENTVKNRYVIARFLTACGVKYVEVDDSNLELYAFIEKHLN